MSEKELTPAFHEGLNDASENLLEYLRDNLPATPQSYKAIRLVESGLHMAADAVAKYGVKAVDPDSQAVYDTPEYLATVGGDTLEMQTTGPLED